MSDYSSNFPTQSPTFAFDAKAGKLDSRISYSRSSTGTYLSSEKALSSENLLPYSNDLSQSVWTKRNLTVPVTNITAPDGTSSASSLLETTATSTHDFYEEFSAVSGASYTFTLYAKANGRDTLHVSPQATSTIASVVFDLTAVTSTVVSGSADSHSISAIGSTGWYKLQVTVTATGSGTGFLQAYFKVGGTTSYAGDATKGAYIWGCQVSSTGETVLNETSGSIHREYSQLLKTASADSPRFEFATDGQSEGLLIESQSSNLFDRSSGFDYTAAWTKTNVTATAEAISPDGTLNAFAIRENSVGGTKRIHQAATVAAGSVAVSVYAKMLGNERRLVIREDSTTGDSAVFDLSSGTVAATNVGGAGTIEAVGNGWYRCTLITSPSGSPGYTFGFWLATATGTNYENYTGDGYSGVLLYGAMCENASASSSYLESLGSTTTRAADSCSVDSATLFDNGGGTLYAEARRNGIDTYNGIASVDDGTGSGDIVQIFGNSTNFRAEIASGGTTVANIMASGHSAGVYYKHCVSFSSSAAKYYVDGSQKASTDTDLNIPSMSQMHLGMLNAATSGNLNGHIKRVALYNVALSDTELQALTS